MAEPDTDPQSDGARTRRLRLPRWARLALVVAVVAIVALVIVVRMYFVTGVPATAERIQNIVWNLEFSQMTVADETTPITVHPNTVGTVFASNGAHLDAANSDGWAYTAAGSWRITDEGEFTINGSPIDARWKWNTLVIEYNEGQLLKHLEYVEGEPFDIRTLAAGTWQGPANTWLWWYKFEGDIITLAEDGTCQIGTLPGTWTVDESGKVFVEADAFQEPQAVFRVEDSTTLSLIDPETGHSLTLMSRIE